MTSRVRHDGADKAAPEEPGPGDSQEWLQGRRARDRVDLVREAGWGQVSWQSVSAGVLAAIGTFTFFIGVAAAVLHPLGITLDDLSDGDWKRLGLIVGMSAAAGLLGAFAFGGYVAGRMARRAGLRHGMLVFLVGVVVLAAAAGIAHFEDALSAIRDRIESLGAPTGDSGWSGISLLSAMVALVGMLVGSLLGGVRGERWHQRLVIRARDSNVGPEAELRADVEARRKAAAKALAKASKAGVLTDEDQSTATETEPAAVEPARSDGQDLWREWPEATAAGRGTTPSSPSSGP